MYRPSKYERHNLTLKVFAEEFNNTISCNEIQIRGFDKENFSDDGEIFDKILKRTLLYDWEVRDKYFSNGKFTFATLGQFERKFHKSPSIDISIQCDKENRYFLVAWHNDFSMESKRIVSRTTDSFNEVGGMRETRYFKIYSYQEMEKFKDDLKLCIKEDNYSFNT